MKTSVPEYQENGGLEFNSECCEKCEKIVPTDSPSGSLMQATYCSNATCKCHTPQNNKEEDPFKDLEKGTITPQNFQEHVENWHKENNKEEITLTKQSVLRQFKQLSDDHQLIPWLGGAIDVLLTSQKQSIMDMCDEIPVPPFPIEDDENEKLVALQEGARLGYSEALLDLKERISKEI